MLQKWLDPPWLVELSAVDREELKRRADVALAQRQLTVGPSYVVFFSAFCALTPFGLEHTTAAVVLGGLLFCITTARWFNSKRIVDQQGYGCLRDRQLFRAGTLVKAIVWSVFVFLGLVWYGTGWTGLILVVSVTGIANGASSSLCLDLRLAIAYLSFLVVPLMGWALAPGQGTILIFAMSGLYLVFLASLSRRQNFAFLSGYRDNMRLQAQAAELNKAKEAAELAAKAKSQFLAAMSHEIRTPLSGVLGLLNLLEETSLDARQKDLTSSIQTSGSMLLTVVNDILDFSKIGAGKLVLDEQPFPLRQAIREAFEPARRIAERKGLDFDCQVSPETPEWIRGDAKRLKQVLVNLLNNALKFTPEGRVDLKVSAVRGGEKLEFVVTDTGIGIAPENRGRLFEEFSQADSSTARQFGGTGLGLAISRRLVEAMGGAIRFESELGAGSRFIFEIPFTKATPQSGEGRAEEPVMRLDGKAGSARLRILVAEDNAVNQRVIAHMVHRAGHTMSLAANGVEVLMMFHREHYDLILMDCQMPIMDGFDATRAIRESGPAGMRVPIVAITANAFEEDRERCLSAGMDAHVSKPVQPAALEAVIAECMGNLERCVQTRRKELATTAPERKADDGSSKTLAARPGS